MMYDHIDMHVIGPVHMLVLGLILIIPFWRLFSKAGYLGLWSLLMLILLVNLIALYVLAFSNWPGSRRAVPWTGIGKPRDVVSSGGCFCSGHGVRHGFLSPLGRTALRSERGTGGNYSRCRWLNAAASAMPQPNESGSYA
jgi:hypothetical protein